MPIYEYECQSCQDNFSELRRMSEMDTSIECPQCGSNDAQRKLSHFAVGAGSMQRAPGPTPCGAQNASQCGSGFS